MSCTILAGYKQPSTRWPTKYCMGHCIATIINAVVNLKHLWVVSALTRYHCKNTPFTLAPSIYGNLEGAWRKNLLSCAQVVISCTKVDKLCARDNYVMQCWPKGTRQVNSAKVEFSCKFNCQLKKSRPSSQRTFTTESGPSTKGNWPGKVSIGS